MRPAVLLAPSPGRLRWTRAGGVQTSNPKPGPCLRLYLCQSPCLTLYLLLPLPQPQGRAGQGRAGQGGSVLGAVACKEPMDRTGRSAS